MTRCRNVSSAGDQLELWAPAAETPLVGPLSDQERRRLLDIQVGDRRLPSRFWAKVIAVRHDHMPSACWTWVGSRNPEGYGLSNIKSQVLMAHRMSWMALVGPIEDGLQLDHLCRVHACVRPAHLDPVPCRENTLRGIGPSACNARKTHCANGHLLSGSNLRIINGDRRECVECRRAWNRKNMRRYRKRGSAAVR
jgi:hypothetical protein